MSNLPTDEINDLLAGQLDAVCLEAATEQPDTGDQHHGGLIFPGSFNPLHAGHRAMARLAATKFNCQVEFELSVVNVDKPSLDINAIHQRASQFAGAHPLWLTRAARFTEKAAIFPAATFVVGIDTLTRLGDARYYGDDHAARDRAIETLAELDAGFLVFGRKVGEQFRQLTDLDIPALLRQLCQPVDAAEFREDISSSELRRQA